MRKKDDIEDYSKPGVSGIGRKISGGNTSKKFASSDSEDIETEEGNDYECNTTDQQETDSEEEPENSDGKQVHGAVSSTMEFEIEDYNKPGVSGIGGDTSKKLSSSDSEDIETEDGNDYERNTTDQQETDSEEEPEKSGGKQVHDDFSSTMETESEIEAYNKPGVSGIGGTISRGGTSKKFSSSDSDEERANKVSTPDQPGSDSEDENEFCCKTCYTICKNREEFDAHVSSRCGTIKYYQLVDLKKHRLEKHRIYTCKRCGKPFSQRSDYDAHGAVHKNDNYWTCYICGKYFTYKNTFRQHMEQHKGKKGLVCKLCNLYFREDSGALRNHLAIFHPRISPVTLETGEECGREKSNKCKGKTISKVQCPYCFEFCKDLKNHYSKFHEQNECEVCGNSFVGDVAFNKHLLKHKKRCPKCVKSFTTIVGFQQHFKAIHGEQKERFLCKKCPEAFNRMTDLTEHLKVHGDEKIFICDICEEYFLQKAHLKSHKRSHTEKRTFQCEICRQVLTRSYSLKRHMDRQHRGKKKLRECQICNQRFLNQSDLLKHLSKHSKDTEITAQKCEFCEKSFENRELLDRHIHQSHLEIKCRICGYEFSSRSSVLRHMTSEHSDIGEKKLYECQICNQRFLSQRDVLKHMSKHNRGKAIKAHKCESCEKSFETSWLLERHIHQSHSKHKCTICGKEFSSTSSVLRHRRQKHSDRTL